MVRDCYVAVKGLICVGDSLLILQKGLNENSHWDVPGGRLNDNESLDEALVRELSEELPTLKSYTVSGIVGAYRLMESVDDKALIFIFYKIKAQKFEINLSSEHVAYRWITKETLPNLLNSKHKIEKGYYDIIAKVFFTND